MSASRGSKEGMVLVPAGEFTMGTAPADLARFQDKFGWPESLFDNEIPRQRPHLEAFYIDVYLVRNRDYKEFVDDGGYDLLCELEGITEEDFEEFVDSTSRPGPKVWANGRFPEDREDHPVVGISWYEALSYAKWAGKRLPSEAEWEKAARGTDGWLWPWGNWWDESRCNVLHDDTEPVGQYPRGESHFGCFDMAGNVWEWTTAKAFPYPYDPNDGREELTGPADRILRGGGRFGFLTDFGARCAYRESSNPRGRLDLTGFRCAADA